MYAGPSLLVDFRNVPKKSQYLWKRSDLFRIRASGQLGYLTLHDCAEVCSFNDSAWDSCYALLLQKLVFIKSPLKWAS